MERPKSLIISPRLAVIIVILFHAVGLAGLGLPSVRPLFLQIVPFHILLMLLIIVLSHQSISARFAAFIFIIFLAGIVLEWIGVHKQIIFGDYRYGKTLGTKVLDIPLTIGVNWFLLIYAAGVTLQRSRLKNMFLRVFTGAALLVLLDLLIEPVAIRFDYWHWTEGVIPLKNYICWFIVGAGMLFVFEKFEFKKQSVVAPVLLLTQFLFFLALNILALL